MTETAMVVIAPLFGLMVVGYVFGRLGLLEEAAGRALNQFVYFLALPSLIFTSLASLSPAAFFNWPFVGALTGGMAATFLIVAVIARLGFRSTLSASGVFGLGGMFSSTGYIGLPIVFLAFSEDAVGPGVFGAVVTGAVFLPLALTMLEYDRAEGGEERALAVGLRALGTPVILACAAGLGASAAALTVPSWLASLFGFLGDAFIPCALIAAGLTFARRSFNGRYEVVASLVVVKLVAHPSITYVLAAFVFDLEGELLLLAVALAALPTGAPVFVLAQRYGVEEEGSAALIAFSTALSAATLPIVFALL
ncbi:MAG: AEC family transporter [Pseudomonadota bacterium]